MKTLALALVLIVFSTPGHAREWESATGEHKVQAKFLRKLGDDIKLKKLDGKIISLKLSQLSKHDQEIIRLLEKHQKEMLEATKKISRLEKDIGRLRDQIGESKRLQDRTDIPRLTGRNKRAKSPRQSHHLLVAVVKTQGPLPFRRVGKYNGMQRGIFSNCTFTWLMVQ